MPRGTRISAFFLCGSTYSSKLGLTKPIHCLIAPSILVGGQSRWCGNTPQHTNDLLSSTILYITRHFNNLVEINWRKCMEALHLRAKQMSESVSTKIYRKFVSLYTHSNMRCMHGQQAPSYPIVPALWGHTAQKFPPVSEHGKNKRWLSLAYAGAFRRSM